MMTTNMSLLADPSFRALYHILRCALRKGKLPAPTIKDRDPMNSRDERPRNRDDIILSEALWLPLLPGERRGLSHSLALLIDDTTKMYDSNRTR